MSASFDLYVERQGWAHRFDPRIKLLFVLAGVASMVLFSNLFFFLAALAIVQTLTLSAGVPGGRVGWLWKAMLPVNVLIPPLWALFYPEGSAAFRWGPVAFTPMALARGLAVAARLDTIAFICFLWLFTTDQTLIVRSLVKLGLPFEWGLVLAISLRYVPTFYGLYTVVAQAQQARALDLDRGNPVQRLRAYIPILIAMIISALRTADRLAQALESRALGYTGRKRTSLRDIHFEARDYVAGALLVVYLAVMIGLRLRGLFVHPFYIS